MPRPRILHDPPEEALRSLERRTAASARDSTLPEGGLTAWLTVAGSWLMLFCTFGYAVNAFGAYQSFYTESFLSRQSSSQISWIGSSILLLQNCVGLFAGRLFDRHYFTRLLITGTLLYTLCLFMLSLARPGKYYQVLLSQGIGPGIALGLIFVPSVGVIAHHFRTRKAFAMGIVISGSSCGGVTFPILVNHLLHKIGFAWTVRTTAFFALALMALGTALMRPRFPVCPDASDSSLDFTADAEKGSNTKKKSSLFQLICSRELLSDHPYWLSVAALFFLNWGTYFPLFYIQEFGQHKGISAGLLGYLLAIINGSSFFGRVLPNLLADKWGRTGALKSLIPCAAVSSALVASMLGIHTSASIVTFAVLFGFVSGAMLSLSPAIFAHFAPDSSQIGFRMGLGFFVAGFGGLTGSPINGALLGPSFVWFKPIAFSTASLAVGSVLLLLAEVSSRRRLD